MLLGDIIKQGVERYPDKLALVYRDQPMTYRELAGAVNNLAAGFASLGIGEGERIALLLPNCTPFVLGYYAAAMLGAVVVPSNPLLKPAELEYIWKDADVRLVLTVPQLLPGVEAARKNLPGIRHIVSVIRREEMPEPELADSIAGFTTLTQLMGQGATMAAPIPDNQNENDCAVIIYTSGTTGHPKGAMLSHRNLIRNVEQLEGVLELTSADCFLTALPLFHAFAGTVCMHAALENGCTSVLMDNFTPMRALEAIEKYHVTIFPAVPALFYALLQAPPDREYDMSSMRVFVSGGAPLPAATLTALEARYNIPVIEGDGPTECSPATSVNPLNGPRKIGSVGPALPGVEIAIFDDNDNPLPPEEMGEIVVRGDNVMLGYLNQPEATAEAMRSGWYHTGDIGKMDTDGYVYILDRKKDMIITAGLNVYPREVEEVLFTHPAIADCAVIGQPEAMRGEEVVAVVVKKPGVDVTERELTAYCRERLANYKVPRQVIFRETLPRGGTGKVVKRLLKKELEMALP